MVTHLDPSILMWMSFHVLSPDLLSSYIISTTFLMSSVPDTVLIMWIQLFALVSDKFARLNHEVKFANMENNIKSFAK